jgi:heme oxygenase
VPLDDLEKLRVVEECRVAFALNTALFAGLGREFPLSA